MLYTNIECFKLIQEFGDMFNFFLQKHQDKNTNNYRDDFYNFFLQKHYENIKVKTLYDYHLLIIAHMLKITDFQNDEIYNLDQLVSLKTLNLLLKKYGKSQLIKYIKHIIFLYCELYDINEHIFLLDEKFKMYLNNDDYSDFIINDLDYLTLHSKKYDILKSDLFINIKLYTVENKISIESYINNITEKLNYLFHILDFLL